MNAKNRESGNEQLEIRVHSRGSRQKGFKIFGRWNVLELKRK